MGEKPVAKKDAALISAAQRAEHYEIAAYSCVRTWAGLLGETKAGTLLEQTLEEEKETDEKLTELAEEINALSLTEDDKVEESEKTNTNVKSRGART